MYDRTLENKPKTISSGSAPYPSHVQISCSYYQNEMDRGDVERLPGRPLDVNVTMNPLLGVGTEFGEISGARIRRAPVLHEGTEDAILFMSSTAGFLFKAEGRDQIRVAAGEVVVVAFSDCPQIAFDRAGMMKSVWIDRRRLQALLPDADLGQIGLLPEHGAAMDMLFGYAEVLARETPIPYQLLRIMASYMIELAALVVTAAEDRARLFCERDARAAQFAAMEADMIRMFQRPTFSEDMLAQKHGFSTGYVQMLFEEAGTTFRDRLQNLRLDFVRTLLMDTPYQRGRIAAIAVAAGFSELTAFNRAFRKRFGCRPSDVKSLSAWKAA